jgi:tetratricopeptide (TPR) repeat protein
MLLFVKRIAILLISCLCLQGNLLMGQTRLDKADSLKSMGNYPGALKLFQIILNSDLETNDPVQISKDYNNIANVYSDMGDYERSTRYYFRALKLAEQNADKKLVAGIYYNLANNYFFIGKKNYVIDFLNKAITTFRDVKDNEEMLGLCYTMLGGTYNGLENYEEAMKCFKMAERLLKNNIWLGNVYNEISFMFLQRGEYESLMEYAHKALEIYKKENDAIGVATAYVNLQMGYIKRSDSAVTFNRVEALNAIAYLDSAFFAIRNIDNVEIRIRIYENKQQLYADIKQYDSAYKYQSKYLSLNDSVHAIEKNKQLDELKMQYDVEKKDQHNLLLQRESQNKNYLLLILGIILIAISSLSVLLARINKLRAKQKAMQLEQQLLRLQMNPHFLFNAINSIQNYILNKSQQEAYDYLAKFAKLIRIVLNNSQEKTLVLHDELEMIDLYIELEQLRFSNTFDFKLKVDPGINEFEVTVPPMLIQPYIENAIWHGLMNLENERKGSLSVEINENNGTLTIIIEDNGIGREKARQYKKEDAHRSVGMALTEQRLLMINKMQEYENANVTVVDLKHEKGMACGTKVEISIPVNAR